jgi:4-hydroxy-tetrahydrodipicolinate reductase
MKIALLGKGKTGSKVLEIIPRESVTIFDSQNTATLEKLKGHDAIISFLPGVPFLDLIPLLLESKLPVVTGSTGFEWPVSLNKDLITLNRTWIWGHNFSMGINLVKASLEILGKAKNIFPEAQFNINEIHHTKKLDAPSGTAISFQNWLKQDCQITSQREGDVVGIHQLCLKTEFESIKLEHEALDRKIFANGAIYAANALVNNNEMPPGLLNFSDFMEEILKI